MPARNGQSALPPTDPAALLAGAVAKARADRRDEADDLFGGYGEPSPTGGAGGDDGPPAPGSIAEALYDYQGRFHRTYSHRNVSLIYSFQKAIHNAICRFAKVNVSLL